MTTLGSTLKKNVILGCCIILLSINSYAKEENKKLIEKADALAKMSQMEQMLEKQSKLSADYIIKQDAKFAPHRAEIEKIFMDSNNPKEVNVFIRDFYLKNYSEKELDEMLAFFKTPTGEKSIRLMPKLNDGLAELLMKNLAANQHKLNNLITK